MTESARREKQQIAIKKLDAIDQILQEYRWTVQFGDSINYDRLKGHTLKHYRLVIQQMLKGIEAL